MKKFPIMSSIRGDEKLYIPWEFAELARDQAFRNHDQTLERLAERGGLDPIEFYGACHGMNWIQLHDLVFDASLDWIKTEMKKYEAKDEQP